MFYFMLELCKSFLSFLLFNYIVRKAPRAQDMKTDLLLLLLLLLLLSLLLLYQYRRRQVCKLSFKQEHCACLRLSWDNLIRMFCKCFYFAGDTGHVDDKLNRYNLDQDSESPKISNFLSQ